MNIDAFLRELTDTSEYAGQIVHVRDEAPRAPEYASADERQPPFLQHILSRIGIERLYSHQAEALRLIRERRDVIVCTGTASGKSLCYVLPILERLHECPDSRALLLFPTKALCQDQFAKFSLLRQAAGMTQHLAGVYDGDTPSRLRRRLRDRASVLFSNPDMLHAGLMPRHGRWAEFLGRLDLIVVDEMHVYSGIFGSNMTHVLTRFSRLCLHYGSHPVIVGCSATIANPKELGDRLTGRDVHVVHRDGSPRGRRVTVFWNPPRIRQRAWRSRRSANVEAHELMSRLIAKGIPTITFSKAKMTAEMIHRYVTERLRQTAPEKVSKVTPYRGGYPPEERREIERRLFSGELLGVSTTPALELGIDVGALEASIVVGYPGTLASFFQQAGRAGRKEADAIVFLIGLDTSVNQYIMSRPDYIFQRRIEQAVIDPENPFVITGHLRCAAQELPLEPSDLDRFGPYVHLALEVLRSNRKLHRVGDSWYHAAEEIPQHEISLRDTAAANVLIEDVTRGAVIGEVNRFDAEPILHPEAIYMHRGDTYRILDLDLDRNIATVKPEPVDYYTQPLGGTDVHHIDHQLRMKPFGSGSLFWGEVTAHFRTYAYEKIHFYSLDALSRHGLDLPTMVLETMAFWLVPPESLMEQVRRAGLDAHGGLRGIGYATRMLLPLFMTCDTLDFSHTVGSVNSPWNAVFVYERYPHGMGFTEKAFEMMHLILPAVLENIEQCSCEEGCPCCVGKPLRQRTTWNVERGEASIPSKASAAMILQGCLGDRGNLVNPDRLSLTDCDDAVHNRLERAVRRRLERMREPQVFHPIVPQPEVKTEYPERERDADLPVGDVSRRHERRRSFERDMHQRLSKKLGIDGLHPLTPVGRAPEKTAVPDASVRPRGMRTPHGNLRPNAFPGKPDSVESSQPPPAVSEDSASRADGASPLPRPRSRTAPIPSDVDTPVSSRAIMAGDALASRARAKLKNRGKYTSAGGQDRDTPDT